VGLKEVNIKMKKVKKSGFRLRPVAGDWGGFRGWAALRPPKNREISLF